MTTLFDAEARMKELDRRTRDYADYIRESITEEQIETELEELLRTAAHLLAERQRVRREAELKEASKGAEAMHEAMVKLKQAETPPAMVMSPVTIDPPAEAKADDAPIKRRPHVVRDYEALAVTFLERGLSIQRNGDLRRFAEEMNVPTSGGAYQKLSHAIHHLTRTRPKDDAPPGTRWAK